MLAELTDLGIDAVALSAVLTSFGRHRLLTFDRDDLSGQATVELAHEALLTEWERLAGWIDRHRSALRRRDALLAAVDEWELSGRDAEYLLTGSRLAELEAWTQEGSLPLTAGERAFLEAGVERREAEVSAEVAREADHLRLARTARTRLLGLAAAAVVAMGLGGAVVYGVLTAPPPGPAPVAFLWTEPGIVNTQVVSGFDRAVADFGLVGLKRPFTDVFATLDAELGEGWADGLSDDAFHEQLNRVQQDMMRALATDGVGLIVTWGAYSGDVELIAREFPETHFSSEQPLTEPNVAVLTFADSEPSYLAGVAAALTSETGTIGYIAGVSWDILWGFQAGYEAGARSVDPDIEILVDYVHADDINGFSDEPAARERALEMYGRGADVIFQAAGTAGLGVFQAASEFSDLEGRHVWAIGVDSDQYETVSDLPGANAEAWREHILTSALKGHETMIYALLAEHAEGTFTPGPWNWGLASGAQGLSYSGGYIDHLRPTLDDLQAQIISGEIVVPCVPEAHLNLAADFGIDPDHCHVGREP
jgi:basic membrane protein A